MNNVTAQSSSSGSRMMTPDAGIALGLGLTNECNLSCAFCYRDPTRADRLSLDQVKAVHGTPARALGESRHRRERHASRLQGNTGLPANETGQAHHHFQRS